jgi:hypothetical protein
MCSFVLSLPLHGGGEWSASRLCLSTPMQWIPIPIKKTKLRGPSPRGNYADRAPLLVGEGSSNFCEYRL